MVWHPTVDLSELRVRPYPAVLGTPEPAMAAGVPTTFEPEEIPVIAWILGGIGLLGGGLLGWQACNLIMSTEQYKSWSKEIIFSILPIRKAMIIGKVGGIIVEIIGAALGVEVPPAELEE